MATDTLVGRTLDEFVLREQLGQGASSIVYLADQPLLERQVVVKLSRYERGAESQGFLREARLASRIEHPFAAHIYGFGIEPDGVHWIAMERVRGTPLSDFIARGPMEPEIAVPFVRRLCDVVFAAHEMGVIHRDIKPANVMVISRGGMLFPKLLDVGVALDQRSDINMGGSKQGTPAYMAPECWVDGKLATVQSDVYSLGILTYELLAGARPFVAQTMLQLARQHASAMPPSLPDTIPAQVRGAVQKAMAKRAAERFATVNEFADALVQTAGVSIDVVGLPRIDELTLAAAVSELPGPIADAVVLLDGAGTAGRALRATQQLAETIAHVVGVFALAAADRVGAGSKSGARPVQVLLDKLAQTGLLPGDWWSLARELTRPFAASPDVFPMRELVGTFFDGTAELTTAMDQWLMANTHAPAAMARADDQRAFLLGVMPLVGQTLRGLQWLSRYRLVSPAEDQLLRVWMGGRSLTGKHIQAPAGTRIQQPCLLSTQDTVAFKLHPYVRETEPAAGEPRELFWVEGPGRSPEATKHRALPQPFTIDAHDTWQAAGTTGVFAIEESPYLGLLTFSEADAKRYFGREREVDAFVNRLRKLPWIAVAGPSGVGKSSFIRAGVLPSLDAAQRLVMRPGSTPSAALRAALSGLGIAVDDEGMRDHRVLAARLAQRVSEAGWGMLVLVIDQFEELVTQCQDLDEQEAFAALAVKIAGDADVPVRVVLTVRDDFLVRVAGLAALRNVISANLQLLTTPSKEDLLRIVVEPARRAGYEFEDAALAQTMVDEVQAMPGALALLSFTCSKLWQLRDRDTRRLTRAAYRSIGGVGGALAQHAEALLEAMPPSDRAIVREVFRHLVTADGTRAELTRSELVQVAGGQAGGPAAAGVIEALINGRLLLASEDARGERVEVVHETLIVNWPRLVGWRAQDAETARLRDQLRAAARQWQERGRDRDLLWRGEALTEFQLWRSRYPGRLTDLEEEFGQRSAAAHTRRRRVAIAALTTLLGTMTVAIIVFYGLRTNAVKAQARAEKSEAQAQLSLIDSYVDSGRRLLLSGDTPNALAFLAAAVRAGRGDPSTQFLVDRATAQLAGDQGLLASGRPVYAASFLGDEIVTSESGGALVYWNLSGERLREVSLGTPGQVNLISVAPGSQRLAVSDVAGVVRVLDAKGNQLATWSAFDHELSSMLFVNQTLLVTGNREGIVKLWDPTTQQLLHTLGAVQRNLTTNVAAHPSAPLVAVGTLDYADYSGGAQLFDWAGRKAMPLVGHTGGISQISFSSTDRVATASYDRSAILWDLRGRRIATLPHTGHVLACAFSADGRMVATSSSDGLVAVWRAADGQPIARLQGHVGEVVSVTFRGNNDLFSISSAGEVIVWDAPSGLVRIRLPIGGQVSRPKFSQDLLVLTSSTGYARILDWTKLPLLTRVPALAPRNADPLLDLRGEFGAARTTQGIELFREGTNQLVAETTAATQLAFDEARGLAMLWDARRISVWRKDGLVLDAPLRIAMPKGVAFEPSSRRLIAVDGQNVYLLSADGTVLRQAALSGGTSVRAVAGGFLVTTDARFVLLSDELSELATSDNAWGTSFVSPDADEFATIATANELVFWRDRKPQAPISLPGSPMGVMWGNDKISIALGDGSIQLRDRQTLRVLTQFVGTDATAYDAVFDGAYLIVSAKNGDIGVWTHAGTKLFGLGVSDTVAFVRANARGLVTAEAHGWVTYELSRFGGGSCALDTLLRQRVPQSLLRDVPAIPNVCGPK